MSLAFRRVPTINRVALAGALLAMATSAGAASLLDPALKFRTLTTEHFFIYYHQGEDHLALRLASIAEDVWPRVGRALGIGAPHRTHVILADQSELANGWATPLPYNTIFLTAAGPPGSDFIGRTDDWLRLVFTHEFTHIVHLDRSAGWARLYRGLFGRAAVAFPNLWLPIWQIEGIAAWEESALTGEGRRYAGDFRAVEREAARAGRFEPLDRVNGGLTDWPNGLAPYAFGLGFHEYLATRFGESRFAELANKTSRRLPFFGSRAFKGVYGEPLGDLWREYEKSVENERSAHSNLSNSSNLLNPTRITHHGHTVLGPRFASDGCVGCSPEVVYTVRNPNAFPSLRTTTVDGSRRRQLTTRYLGSTVGIGNDVIVFDQQELRRNVALSSDLYLVDRRSGAVRALTRNARLQDPDLSPDGESIVCVRQNGSQRDLVMARLKRQTATVRATVRLKPETMTARATVADITTLISEPDTQFNAPRWSPDGLAVAVERHRLGAQSEIVIVDIASRSQRVAASDPSARIVTPTWRPDGRAIIAAADFGGDTFNLYEFAIAAAPSAPRPLTQTQGGALWPDVSRDGTLVAFVGYTADGFDVFTVPYPLDPGSTSTDSLVGARPAAIDDISRPEQPTTATRRPYSPVSTLAPRSWTPIVESTDQLRLGAMTSGVDVLGRHSYSAAASWLITVPDNALASNAMVPDWQLDYGYDRWWPTLFVSATSNTLFSAGPPDEKGRPASATLHERETGGGIFMPIRHVRSSQRMLLSVVRTTDRYSAPAGTTLISRTASRIGVAANTSRSYGYSISPEHGVTLGGTAEIARRAWGSTADATTLTADGRVYLPGVRPHHVVAVRAAAGTSSGTAQSRRTFLLGGGGSAGDVLDSGREAVSLLRGFRPRSFAGAHVALMNVDYRWPLARPQRGIGTWPLLLHTVHAALFADAGHAWTDQFRHRDLKTSTGAELSFGVVAGYAFPLTTTVGVAWGHDGAETVDRATVYVRVGRAF
jgi:hypothetical protein